MLSTPGGGSEAAPSAAPPPRAEEEAAPCEEHGGSETGGGAASSLGLASSRRAVSSPLSFSVPCSLSRSLAARGRAWRTRPLEGDSGRVPTTRSRWSMLRTRRQGGAWRTRPLEGERGRTVTCNPMEFDGGLAGTAPAGAAATTGTAETVGMGELLNAAMSKALGSLVLMTDADRGVAPSSGDSWQACGRTFTAEAERVSFTEKEAGEKLCFCGSGVKEWEREAAAGVAASVFTGAPRAEHAPARAGVGRSAMRTGLLACDGGSAPAPPRSDEGVRVRVPLPGVGETSHFGGATALGLAPACGSPTDGGADDGSRATSSWRWDRNARRQLGLEMPMSTRSASDKLPSTLPLMSFSRRQSMASDGNATEAAHDTTSSAVHSESLDGCWRGGAQGLVGREAGAAAGGHGEA